MCVTSLACAPNVSAQHTATPALPRLGINLAGANDWSTELPFADVFRLSRPWISQKSGLAWGHGPALALDAQGWVKHLEPGCWVDSPLCTIEGGHYPSGEYTVLYQGQGSLNATGAAQVVAEAPGILKLRVDSSRGGFFLQIRATNPSDHVRNIRVYMPGQGATEPLSPWNPTLIRRWSGVTCVRFMDLMVTNGSTIKSWSDRPKMEDANWSQKGVPLEALIDLANLLHADPWFCIPHQADDEYVAEFAKLVKARLNPKHKAYVEYSNEVWNSSFPQNHYACNEGVKLKLAAKPWEAGWKYTALRSVQIFKICEQIIPKEQLVRVLGSIIVNPYISEQILSFQDAYRHADALAVAPYLSMIIKPDGQPAAKDVITWTVDRALDYVANVSLPEVTKSVRDQRVMAKKYGLPLVAYEGGQHMVGVAGAENLAGLTKLFQLANAHPRMEAIYAHYFDAWKTEGGGLFCHFSSVSEWSKWGSWGLLQYADENPAGSPKFRATMDWAKRQGQAVNFPGP